MTTTEDKADFLRYVERYLGRFPAGVEGEREIRSRISPPFMDTTPEDVARDDVTLDELNAWREYMGWSLWDVIAARSTEGESGLIPRQEYETLSFLQIWGQYPAFMRAITDAVGVDGVIEMGRTPHREVGSKLNITRNWSTQNCCYLGRATALKLGLEQPSDRLDDLAIPVQFARRLMHGTFGSGPGFLCGNDYKAPLLGNDLVEMLLAAEHRLDDAAEKKAFRQFNASTELLGFIMHYDCRFGLQDTGPYPVPGGGFMIVRDHYLHEPAYSWSAATEGLPYCVVEAMVFRPNDDTTVRINDIATTFASPADYLKHLSGVAVFARDREDTPMSELRQLDDAEMASIAKRAQVSTMVAYQTLASKDRDQKILDGITVYTTEHIAPMAKQAGIWDSIRAEVETLHPLTTAGWPTLTSGNAADILSPLFVKGEAYAPIQEYLS